MYKLVGILYSNVTVAKLTVETIALMLMGRLCIFFRKQMIAVLGVCSGRQYSAILGDRSPD